MVGLVPRAAILGRALRSSATASMNSDCSPQKSNVCAIVVTYHPDDSLADRFAPLREQVGSLLIVDNNSTAGAVSMLRQMAVNLDTGLILNLQNLGVATAFNVALEYAIAAGYQWALLFDQDTSPGDGVLKGLQEAYKDFPTKDVLAIIGSNYVEPQTGRLRFSRPITNGRSWRTRRVVITSGSLLSLHAYKLLGPFRDEYFIDCVDLEYCLRARSKGFEVIATTKALMHHFVGQPRRLRVPWRDIELSDHAPIRQYYMIRNNIDMAKRYILQEPLWLIASLWTRLKSTLALCLFQHDRGPKMKYSVLGLLDGLCSRFDRDVTAKHSTP